MSTNDDLRQEGEEASRKAGYAMLNLSHAMNDVQYGLGHVENDPALQGAKMTIEQLQARIAELEANPERAAVHLDEIIQFQMMLAELMIEELDRRYLAGKISGDGYRAASVPLLRKLMALVRESQSDQKG